MAPNIHKPHKNRGPETTARTETVRPSAIAAEQPHWAAGTLVLGTPVEGTRELPKAAWWWPRSVRKAQETTERSAEPLPQQLKKVSCGSGLEPELLRSKRKSWLSQISKTMSTRSLGTHRFRQLGKSKPSCDLAHSH